MLWDILGADPAYRLELDLARWVHRLHRLAPDGNVMHYCSLVLLLIVVLASGLVIQRELQKQKRD